MNTLLNLNALVRLNYTCKISYKKRIRHVQMHTSTIAILDPLSRISMRNFANSVSRSPIALRVCSSCSLSALMRSSRCSISMRSASTCPTRNGHHAMRGSNLDQRPAALRANENKELIEMERERAEPEAEAERRGLVHPSAPCAASSSLRLPPAGSAV